MSLRLPVYLGQYEIQLGADETIDVTLTDRDGQTLVAATATIEILTTAGTVVLAAASCSMSGVEARVASYRVTTGAGKILTTAGTYKAIIRGTVGSDHPQFEFDIVVYAKPY